MSSLHRLTFMLLAVAAVACSAASAAQNATPPAGPACEASVGPLDNWADVKRAVKDACPGQVITVAPGRYRIDRRDVIGPSAHGTAEAPITFRAPRLGDVVLEVNFREGSRIKGSYWIFENFELRGVCANHNDCEHAFHLQPGAHHIVIRNNRIIDFDAGIKASTPYASPTGEGGVSYGLVERNWFYNTTPRDTKRPVNSINIDGGRGWIVRDNFIADFQMLQGSKVAYGAFMKWDSFDGVFERNLVICEWRHRGGIRIGLSFGGGGSKAAIEHTNGIIRNNIVMNCPNDVGIYINSAAATKIYNNTLYNTAGIDVRFPESDAQVFNNIVSGGVRERNSGTAVVEHNIIAGTELGVWLPGLSRYLKHRLDGQDRKYPNYIDKSDVDFAQSLVGDIIEEISQTWVGRGLGTMHDLFVNPAAGDFTLREPGEVVDQGMVLPEVADDFCGQPRRPPHDLGALEYASGGTPPCEILDMIRRMPTAD